MGIPMEDIPAKRMKAQAAIYVAMFDSALNLLGPDDELLTEVLYDLGKRHVRYGVEPFMYKVMEGALMYALEKHLEPNHFTKHVKEAWQQVYRGLAGDMVAAWEEAKGGSQS